MSTKNLYYRTVFRRENVIKSFIFDLFKKICSYPKLAIEVFTRQNFGQRYFTLSSALGMLAFLVLFPLMLHRLEALSGDYSESGSFWGKFATWYMYVIGYVYFAFKRWLEIQHSPSTYDFTKFTLYSGDIDNRLFQINLFGKATPRLVEIVYEPGVFLAVGLLLAILGKPVGFLLVVCSIIYSISYLAAYKQGDDFLLDLIDEKLMNDEFRSAFVNDLMGHETRGVRYYMRKPTSPANRSALESSVLENVDENDTITYAD